MSEDRPHGGVKFTSKPSVNIRSVVGSTLYSRATGKRGRHYSAMRSAADERRKGPEQAVDRLPNGLRFRDGLRGGVAKVADMRRHLNRHANINR